MGFANVCNLLNIFEYFHFTICLDVFISMSFCVDFFNIKWRIKLIGWNKQKKVKFALWRTILRSLGILYYNIEQLSGQCPASFFDSKVIYIFDDLTSSSSKYQHIRRIDDYFRNKFIPSWMRIIQSSYLKHHVV